jgi:hypothetical protein
MPAGKPSVPGGRAHARATAPTIPIDLVVYAGKAEPKRFGLVSDDEAHVRGFMGVVPFPNSTTDKGCRLESIIGTPNGESTFIQGDGFEPNAELTIDSQSYDEKHRAVSSGSFRFKVT